MATYSYNKLDPQRKEIRLCKIFNGALDDPLQSELAIVSLDDNPIYETVSYTWGAPTFNKDIKVNGDLLTITTILHTALRYLRWTGLPRVLWADGMCINQADLDERASQVSMMDSIFEKSQELQIWLGEVSEMIDHGHSSKIGFEFPSDEELRTITGFLGSQGPSKHYKFHYPSQRTLSTDADASVLGALHIVKQLAEHEHLYEMPIFSIESNNEIWFSTVWYNSVSSFIQILSAAWWTRLWIVQEAILSARSLVHIGTHEIPLSTFLQACDKIQDHVSYCCDGWCRIWGGNLENVSRILEPVCSISKLQVASNLYARGETLSLMHMLPSISANRAVQIR